MVARADPLSVANIAPPRGDWVESQFSLCSFIAIATNRDECVEMPVHSAEADSYRSDVSLHSNARFLPISPHVRNTSFLFTGIYATYHFISNRSIQPDS